MNDMQKFGAILVPIVWLVGIVIGIIIFFACSIDDRKVWLLSYVLGLVTALMNFGLMMKSNRKMVSNVINNEPKPVQKFMTAFGLRMLVFVAVFGAMTVNIATSDSPRFNLLPAFIGYMLLKVVMVILVLIKKGKVVNEC